MQETNGQKINGFTENVDIRNNAIQAVKFIVKRSMWICKEKNMYETLEYEEYYVPENVRRMKYKYVTVGRKY